MFNKVAMEDFAMSLRDLLEIDSKIILNPNHLDTLSQKIEEKLEGFKIVHSEHTTKLILENTNFFTIHICGNEENQFYDLVEQLTFAILLDKRSLNAYQLKHTEFYFPRISKDNGAAHYLMRAFMMPSKAFSSTLTKYSLGDGSIRMIEMQREVNKYCYKRGIDLQIWR